MMVSALHMFHIPHGSSSTGLPWTTNMTLINLLTLVMMTLPGMTSSFAQKTYVCCNQPPTPPSPRHNFKSKLRAIALSLAKRDDRYAPVRWAYSHEAGMGPSSTNDNDNVAIPANVNIPGAREGGRYRGAEAGRRPELLGLLNMLDSSGKPYSSRGAVSSSDGDGTRPLLVVDYPSSSASADKREEKSETEADGKQHKSSSNTTQRKRKRSVNAEVIRLLRQRL